MGVLPIGFFAPLPLAIMIPFMAAQSFAMGQAFGTSFQYGKRKISSMSNEEFNAVTPTSLHDDLQADVRAMIPSMNESFNRMERFQIEIIQSMLDTFVLALKEFGQFLAGGISAGTNAINQGFNTDVITVETRADIPSYIPQASADTQYNPQIQTKFADDYEREADRLPFKLLTSIVSKFGQTSSLKTYSPEMRTGYKNSFFRREAENKAKQRTVQEGIETSSSGLVKQIATKFNNIKLQLESYLRTRTSTKLKTFYATVKSYNQFVQLNRKRDMTIDAAKTIALRRLTLRYK